MQHREERPAWLEKYFNLWIMLFSQVLAVESQSRASPASIHLHKSSYWIKLKPCYFLKAGQMNLTALETMKTSVLKMDTFCKLHFSPFVLSVFREAATTLSFPRWAASVQNAHVGSKHGGHAASEGARRSRSSLAWSKNCRPAQHRQKMLCFHAAFGAPALTHFTSLLLPGLILTVNPPNFNC